VREMAAGVPGVIELPEFAWLLLCTAHQTEATVVALVGADRNWESAFRFPMSPGSAGECRPMRCSRRERPDLIQVTALPAEVES